MGLQNSSRSGSGLLWRIRLARVLRQLYPGFVARDVRFSPLAILSITYVLSIVGTGVYLVYSSLLDTHTKQLTWSNTFLLALFTWCIAMCVTSYLLTALSDPGRIPDSWKPPHVPSIITKPDGTTEPPPPPTPAVNDAMVAMLTNDGTPRFCQKCRCFKPDRTHHCSSCQRCVTLMDHHCPFTGANCIGFANRKFFLLFLYYASAGCALVTILSPGHIFHELDEFGRDNADVSTCDVLWIVCVIFGYMLCMVHALALAGFAGFHTFLVLRNRTTIENNEPRQALHNEALKRMDTTPRNHWRAIMGTNPWLWLIPVTAACQGDGVHWRIQPRIDDLV